MTTASEVRNVQRTNGRKEKFVTTERPDRLWTIHDVSRFLGVPVGTLYQWRYQGVGPAAYRLGKHLRYDPAAVHRWLAEQAG